MTFRDHKNVTGIVKYSYLEYDAKGNWIKGGLEYGPFKLFFERTITYFE